MILELERLYNHLHDLSALCAGVGFDPGTMTFAALKERAQRVNERVAGHRFLFGAVRLGEGTGSLDAATAAAVRHEIEAIGAEAAAAWRTLTFMDSVQDRLRGVGQLARQDAERWGAVGPVARASGVHRDARTDVGRAAVVPGRAARAARAADRRRRRTRRGPRRRARADLRDAGRPARRAARARAARPRSASRPRSAPGRVESPRGATLCCVEAQGGHITRLHLRTASYANWPVLARVVPGAILPDFPLINKSFELCYACVDR